MHLPKLINVVNMNLPWEFGNWNIASLCFRFRLVKMICELSNI